MFYSYRCKVEVYGYISMLFHCLSFFLSFFLYFFLTKENYFCDFLFASPAGIALPECSLLLKIRICSFRSKFFPFRVDPFYGREAKMKMTELFPMKMYLFT